MIKKFILLFTSLTVLILSSCTISKAAEPERSITVTGRASVAVKADIISLDFLVRNIQDALSGFEVLYVISLIFNKAIRIAVGVFIIVIGIIIYLIKNRKKGCEKTYSPFQKT